METSNVESIETRRLVPNPENPRLIFREEELNALQESIRAQGVLVPLTVYRDYPNLVILDGERRWRCAKSLALPRVPAIVVPKPERLQNIMMMFAIHNARRDWDPLPTAYKLKELEEEFRDLEGRGPREAELAQLASLSRGEVRRLRRLLALPDRYREQLMKELDKPRNEQSLTVDHVLEVTKGASALRKRELVDDDEESELCDALVEKFKNRVLTNTVEPRKLSRIARAAERGGLDLSAARKVVLRLAEDPKYTIDQAFRATTERIDFEHTTEQLAGRLLQRIGDHINRGYKVRGEFEATLRELLGAIRELLK